MAEDNSKIKVPQGTDEMKNENRKEITIHLQMIQNIVDRMARCSFWIKGWTIALVIAVLAVMFRMGGDPKMYLIIIPIILLGLLDAYYLWQERCFRGAYDRVRLQTKTDFSMKPDMTHKYLPVIKSKTILWFYVALCGLIGLTIWNITDTGLVKFILKEICNG